MDTKRLMDEREEDSEENLRCDYFDSTEDEESTRRFVKPMATKQSNALRDRGVLI